MKAGVIGINWGRVHIHGLRLAGVAVEAVCARDPVALRQVADAERIPRATTNPADLMDLDLVVVATPADTHAPLLALFPDQPVICEKPLLAAGQRPSVLPVRASPAWVNYAFGFLDTARAAASAARTEGALEYVRLVSRVSLPGAFTAPEWFLETASHPLSWLVGLLGTLQPMDCETSASAVNLDLRATGGGTVHVEFRIGGEPGIAHAVEMFGNGASVTFDGGFRPGETWRFSPVRVNATAKTDGEWIPEDSWIRANYRAIDALVGVIRDRRPASDGLQAGLFDIPRALQVESVLR